MIGGSGGGCGRGLQGDMIVLPAAHVALVVVIFSGRIGILWFVCLLMLDGEAHVFCEFVCTGFPPEEPTSLQFCPRSIDELFALPLLKHAIL